MFWRDATHKVSFMQMGNMVIGFSNSSKFIPYLNEALLGVMSDYLVGDVQVSRSSRGINSMVNFRKMLPSIKQDIASAFGTSGEQTITIKLEVTRNGILASPFLPAFDRKLQIQYRI